MPPTKQYPDRAFLKAIRELQPADTQRVLEQVGISRRSGFDRLEQLEEQGKIEREQHGKYTVWKRIEQENELTEIFNQIND